MAACVAVEFDYSLALMRVLRISRKQIWREVFSTLSTSGMYLLFSYIHITLHLRSPHLQPTPFFPKHQTYRPIETNHLPTLNLHTHIPPLPPHLPSTFHQYSNPSPENILRIRKHIPPLPLREEVGLKDGIRDGLDGPEGRHKGRHVRVVGAEDELAGRAVGEQAFDLVVHDGAGGVVPESGLWGEALVGTGFEVWFWFGAGEGKRGRDGEAWGGIG